LGKKVTFPVETRAAVGLDLSSIAGTKREQKLSKCKINPIRSTG